MDQNETFAHGATEPFEMVDKTFRLTQAENDAKLTKMPGTYQGKKVEVWTAKWNIGNQQGVGRTLTVYIDSKERLPIAALFEHDRPKDL